MKNLTWLLIVLPILGLIVVLLFGYPALDWVGFILNFIGKIFIKVGDGCKFLQRLINNFL